MRKRVSTELTAHALNPSRGVITHYKRTLQEADHSAERLEKILERAESAYLTYKSAYPAEKRELVETVTSNREVAGKNLEVTLDLPFSLSADRRKSSNGGP